MFLPKYLEAQFYVQPNAGNIATGTCFLLLRVDFGNRSVFKAIATLLPTGCGIIIGCFLYRYCDLKPKHSTLITMATSILFFVGFLVLIAFRCDTRRLAGVRTSTG